MSVTAVPLQPIRRGSVRRFWLAVVLVLAIAAILAWAGSRQFGQTAAGGGNGRLGRLQVVGGVAPRRFAAVDFFLQAFYPPAQLGSFFFGLGLFLRQRGLGPAGQAGP